MTADLAGNAAAGLQALVTESVRGDLADLDLMDTHSLVRLMAEEDAAVYAAVKAVAGRLADAIDAIVTRLRQGGRLVYVGAGTSGRLGQLDAAELGPTFGVPPGRVVAVMAGGDGALAAASEAAEDDPERGAAQMRALRVGGEDAVVGITASGRTPYVLYAVAAARASGALTVGVACNPGAELSGRVDHPLEVLTGPEVIAGSTRLKAGTAQKLVLNTISTVAMVRLGKTYGNLMVDVRASNTKLRDRARRIVETATGADAPAVAAALQAAGGEVKPAIVQLLAGVDASEAARRLGAAGGVVRSALEDSARGLP